MVNSNVKVNVPGRSGFDRSFKNIFTTKVGTLTPMVSKFVIPGAKGRLKIALSAALPPLASDCFLRADFKVEAFLVPLRLLYGGYESYLTGKKLYSVSLAQEVVAQLPRVSEAAGSSHPYFAPGTLADYLGCRCDKNETTSAAAKFSILKFVCYHRIFDDWYRSARIQRPVFVQPVLESGVDHVGASDRLRYLPYTAFSSIIDFSLSTPCNDGVALGQLRQRLYGDDYFTIARASAQDGAAHSVTVDSTGTFTIAALRASNSLQQYSERSSLASPRLQDFVHAHYGADLSNGVAQRAILLGSASYPVYSKGVPANSDVTASNNPFTSVGARYGQAFASGTDFVCEYEANEPCLLMVIGSLVPEANYSSGVTKDNLLFTQAGSQVDLPDPLLENTGNEPIGSIELTGSMPINPLGIVFGYVPKNSWYKTSVSEVHGLLRAGMSLESFIPQRDLSGAGFSIGTSFLEIPTTALDNVTAVTADLSNYGVWVDSYIDMKESAPLTESAMPSLQDPAYEHGKTVTVNTNGGHI